MKNPLTIALGGALKEIRAENSIPIDDLVKEIGINISYYRLLESGTNAIHISKVIDIVNAFNHYGASLDYEGFSKILTGIYFTNSIVKDIEEERPKKAKVNKNKLFEHINIYDKKLFILLKEIDKLDLFSILEEDTKNVVQKLKNAKIITTVINFICNYADFGESNLEIQNMSIYKDLKSLPTIYFEFINDFIENLLYLPTVMGGKTIWEWENKNRVYFKEMICLTTNPKSVVSKENLSNYTFDYLWEDSLDSAKIIMIDDENEKTNYSESFKKILKAELIARNETKKIERFDEATNKIKFKIISNSYQTEKITSLLTGKSIQTKADKSDNEKYDAIWIFSLKKEKDLTNIAFLADINYEKSNGKLYRLKNAVSLNYETMKNKFEELTNLWYTLENTK